MVVNQHQQHHLGTERAAALKHTGVSLGQRLGVREAEPSHLQRPHLDPGAGRSEATRHSQHMKTFFSRRQAMGRLDEKDKNGGQGGTGRRPDREGRRGRETQAVGIKRQRRSPRKCRFLGLGP